VPDLSSSDAIALVVGLLLTAVLIVAAFYVLGRLRKRRQQQYGGPPVAPEVASDRAFNRLSMARKEADLLERQGVDVAPARTLIGLSESSFGHREFDRAYELAQSAHEALVAARKGLKSGPSLPLVAGPRDSTPSLPGSGSPLPAPGGRSGASPPPVPAAPKVPKNRVESQFEIRLLEDDLAKRGRPGKGGNAKAEALRTEAQAAYDRADYTEAFRLALRGRREVGGHVETLAPGPVPASEGGLGSGGPLTAGSRPGLEAERLAGSERCPQCGHPNLPSDAFCRGCGASRVPAACPQCGATRGAIDTFCGRCGQRFA